MGIIEAFINFVVEASFEVGSFLQELFSLGKRHGPDNPVSTITRVILSLIGGFVICSLTFLFFWLIIWATFKYLF